MSEFFLNIVNMSISASWIVLAVLLLRVLLQKAPKWINVVLWGIVGVRLICPFSIESALSLMPSSQTINPEVALNTPAIDSGVPTIDNVINPIIGEATITFQPEKDLNFFQFIMPYLAVIWLIGIIALSIYSVSSFVRLKKKVGTAVLLRDNIYQSENVSSPFVLGVMKPKIYIPFSLSDQDLENVIAHEQAHIQRKDHWWKPLGFLVLTLHWFNPLMWIAFTLLCRDIELACDEKVVEELNNEQRANYSQTLLSCSVNRRTVAACPLAFGEVGVKDRVKSVLNYKKPAFWIVTVAIVLSVITAVCFLTNPQSVSEDLSLFIDGQIMEFHRSEYTDSNFVVVSHKEVGVKKALNKTTVYMWVLYDEFSCENGEIHLETSSYTPTAITVKRTDSSGHYSLVEYWVPGDGSLYISDIKAKFPWFLRQKLFNSEQEYLEEQKEFCENAAKEHFSDVSPDSDANAQSSVVSTDMKTLKELYPQFFNLSTDGGLTVCVWQTEKDNYKCYLTDKFTDSMKNNSFNYETHATISEIRAILASYGVDKNDVTIRAVINPRSNYHYEINDSYREKVTEIFWADIADTNKSQPATDSKTDFDFTISDVLKNKYSSSSDGFNYRLLANEWQQRQRELQTSEKLL